MSCETAQVQGLTRYARKVLVVDLGFLGDSVHLVPALWEVKRNWSGATLHVLTSTVGAQVAGLVPCVDRVWGLDMYPETRRLRQHLQVLAALRRERFDLAINFSGADRTLFLTGLSGARVRVAHAAARHHFWNRWLVENWVSRRDALLPVYEQKREVLRACGADLQPTVWDLRIPSAALRRAESLVPAGAIHFSLNTSLALREWPVSHWVELAKSLRAADQQVKIIASGSNRTRERERLQTFAREVGDAGVQVLPAELSIAELAAVLQRCRCHVGADSGVLHLALALGIRTVALFREYPDANAWVPRGPGHRILTVSCPCLSQRQPTCPPEGPPKCLAAIAPAQVAAAIEEILAPLIGGSGGGYRKSPVP